MIKDIKAIRFIHENIISSIGFLMSGLWLFNFERNYKSFKYFAIKYFNGLVIVPFEKYRYTEKSILNEF